MKIRYLLSSFLITLTFFLSLYLPCILSAKAATSPKKLKGVTREIFLQQCSLTQQRVTLTSLQKKMEGQELKIASLEKRIEANQKKLELASRNINKIGIKIERIEHRKEKQLDHLVKLIRNLYVTKRTHSPSLTLRSKSREKEDRVTQYSRYIATAHAMVIKKLERSVYLLKLSRDKINNTRRGNQDLIGQSLRERDELRATQNIKRSLARKVRANVASRNLQVLELGKSAFHLKSEIDRRNQSQVPVSGMLDRGNKLPWPLRGDILHKFGDLKKGQVNWKGIVIGAKYGQSVRAVYPGKIVFSEYLRGYGLVILIDHGKGDMTLYGFNQSLLKREGETVLAREIISLTGDTGEKAQPSLYFEIRRNGRAEDPLHWLTKGAEANY